MVCLLLRTWMGTGAFPGWALISANGIPEDVLPAYGLKGLAAQATAAFTGIDNLSSALPELFYGQDQGYTRSIEYQQEALTLRCLSIGAGIRCTVQMQTVAPITLGGFQEIMDDTVADVKTLLLLLRSIQKPIFGQNGPFSELFTKSSQIQCLYKRKREQTAGFLRNSS